MEEKQPVYELDEALYDELSIGYSLLYEGNSPRVNFSIQLGARMAGLLLLLSIAGFIYSYFTEFRPAFDEHFISANFTGGGGNFSGGGGGSSYGSSNTSPTNENLNQPPNALPSRPKPTVNIFSAKFLWTGVLFSWVISMLSVYLFLYLEAGRKQQRAHKLAEIVSRSNTLLSEMSQFEGHRWVK